MSFSAGCDLLRSQFYGSKLISAVTVAWQKLQLGLGIDSEALGIESRFQRFILLYFEIQNRFFYHLKCNNVFITIKYMI